MFVSDDDRVRLSQADEASINATFKVIKGNKLGFVQMLIITIPISHGPFADLQGYPAACVLMRGQQVANYTAVYKFLNEICPDFKPRKVLVDLEQANIQALRQFQERIGFEMEIMGCIYHTYNAIQRQYKKVGLEKAEFEGTEVSQILRLRGLQS